MDNNKINKQNNKVKTLIGFSGKTDFNGQEITEKYINKENGYDGSDIPIDPLTSQILVKYIEGLSSSEKNRTIQQIQRTERAFMKVPGKAHESI